MALDTIDDPRVDDRRSALAAKKAKHVPPNPGGRAKVFDTFADARAALRSEGLIQAGFKAELVQANRSRRKEARPPILYMEGDEHRRMRSATARFFAPRMVQSQYVSLMQEVSARLAADFQKKGRARLDDLSLELSVIVAGRIIGLTDSNPHGMAKRLDAFFSGTPVEQISGVRAWASRWMSMSRMLSFFHMDVKPAIKRRRLNPQPDVISHLISEGYDDAGILIECFTFGAAGMVTTREFVTMAAWRILEGPGLKDRFLAADPAGKEAILEEILRLEPVVGSLYRRAADGAVAEGCPVAHGELAIVDIRAANTDPDLFGPDALTLNLDRGCPKGTAAGMSFGDGAHRCPGAGVALQETAIFLDALLAVPGLRLERAPTVGWNPLITGYELRDAWLTTAPANA